MPKTLRWIKAAALIAIAAGLAANPTRSSAADNPSSGTSQSSLTSGLYLKVRLSSSIKMSKLKPGDVVAGRLSRDVYSESRMLFPSGSDVRLTVDHLESRKRTPNDHWPWVVRAFAPRHERYPVFKSATVAHDESSLQVVLISSSRMRDVHASAKRTSAQSDVAERGAVDVSRSSNKRPAAPTLVLEAFGIENASSVASDRNETDAPPPPLAPSETLPAGTRCRILLLDSVSASKSAAGGKVQARLLEPVVLNSRVVLPAGSLFEGKVVKKTPPRWLSRSGSLYLTFTEVTLIEGRSVPIAASLAGAQLDERSHTRMDAEGQLHGERPGRAWMAINLGMTAGISKEVDDGVQLVIEALVSTATDASTAGTSRIISTCVSGLYMATRRGRDVVLPRFTEMDISFDRPVDLKPARAIEAFAGTAEGK